MKRALQKTAAFSLVEVALALGVAALCLILLLGLLPAAIKVQQASVQQTAANEITNIILADLNAYVRLPPGQQKKSQEGQVGLGLNGHWGAVATPQTTFFNDNGQQVGQPSLGSTDPDAPAGAVFRAKITYQFPPNASTSIATIFVSWPAQVKPTTGTPAGSVETFIAVNR